MKADKTKHYIMLADIILDRQNGLSKEEIINKYLTNDDLNKQDRDSLTRREATDNLLQIFRTCDPKWMLDNLSVDKNKKAYTSGDLFNYLNEKHNKELVYTPQILGFALKSLRRIYPNLVKYSKTDLEIKKITGGVYYWSIDIEGLKTDLIAEDDDI